jgi:hypothetical protein
MNIIYRYVCNTVPHTHMYIYICSMHTCITTFVDHYSTGVFQIMAIQMSGCWWFDAISRSAKGPHSTSFLGELVLLNLKSDEVIKKCVRWINERRYHMKRYINFKHTHTCIYLYLYIYIHKYILTTSLSLYTCYYRHMSMTCHDMSWCA